MPSPRPPVRTSRSASTAQTRRRWGRPPRNSGLCAPPGSGMGPRLRGGDEQGCRRHRFRSMTAGVTHAARGGRIDASAPSGTTGDIRRFLLAAIGARPPFRVRVPDIPPMSSVFMFRAWSPASCSIAVPVSPPPAARAADPNSRVMCAGARARLRAFRGGANRAPDCPRARGLNAGARLPSVPREFFSRRRRRGRRSGFRMPLLSYTITEFAVVKLF